MSGKTLILASTRAALERQVRLALVEQPCRLGLACHTLHSLAAAVADDVPGRARVLSGLARRQAVKEAMQETGLSDPAWQTNGAQRAMEQLLTEMRLAQSPADAGPDWLQKVRQAYERRLGGRLDWPGVIQNLLQILQSMTQPQAGQPPLRTPQALRDIEKVRLIGFHEPEPWEAKILSLLKTRFQGRLECADEPDPDTGALPAWMRQTMAGNRAELPADPNVLACPEAIELHEFATIETECRGLARRLRALLAGVARAGNPCQTVANPEHILIICPESPDWRKRLATVLDRYEIPHDAGAGIKLSASPLGEFVLRLAGLGLERFEGSDFVWLLASPYVRGRELWGEAGRVSARGAARLLLRHHLRAGTWEEWTQGIRRLVGNLRNMPANADDEKEAVAARASRNADDLERLMPALDKLRAWFDVPGSQTGAQWAEWLLNLLADDRLGVTRMAAMHGQDENADDLSQRQAVVQVLARIREEHQTPMPRQAFVELLQAELDADAWNDARRNTKSISIRAPNEIEAGHWKHVFVVGLGDGVLPAFVQESGLIGDTARRSLGLPDAATRNDRAERQLLRAMGLARERIALSWSRQGEDGRRRLPSPVIQRLDDRLASWIQVEKDGKKRDMRVSRLFPSASQSAETNPPLWVTLHSPREILALENAVLADEACIANQLAGASEPEPEAARLNEWSDPENWMTPAQGQSPEQAVFGSIPLDDRGLHPSRLNSFGQCPFRYFAQSVLGLERPRELDLAPDPAELGTLLHETLEKVLTPHLGNTKAFICADEDQLQKRVQEFGQAFDQELAAACDNLCKKGMSLEPAALEPIRDRWTRAAMFFASECLYKLDPELKWQQWDALMQKVWTKIDKGKKDQDIAGARQLAEAYEKAKLAWTDLPASGIEIKGFKTDFEKLESIYKDIRSNPTWIPFVCEWSFRDPSPLEVEVGGQAKIRLRGTIDRIDIATLPTGAVMRVADYKSGMVSGSSALKNEIHWGINLQLPAYALAVEAAQKSGRWPRELQGHANAQLTQVGLIALKQGKESCVAVDMEKARDWIRLAAEFIATGRLAPKPKDNKCPALGQRGFCDYPGLCRAALLPKTWFEDVYLELRPEKEKAP